MRRLALRLLAVLMAMLPIGVAAQPVQPDPALRAKAEALIPILDGRGSYATYFAATFRDKVPAAQLSIITTELKASLGAPQRIEAFTATSAWAADLTIGYARGTASVRLVIDPAPPHAATGLLITGTAPRDDTIDKLQAEFRALPGTSGFGVYALGDAAPLLLDGYNPDKAAPLGSAFKLWALAELARQVAQGERSWDHVLALAPPSLPSGVLQTWPARTPMTLQSLAAMMISISDNTATDTLVAALGRDRVDAMAASAGGSVPVMTTREMFAIKADPALTATWATASPEQRRTLLSTNAARFAAATLDASVFTGKPVAVDTVEWFASPAAMAGVLDRLRTADPTTRAILAINPGIDPATARRFRYVGFKGGGEPGVVALDYLVQAKDGRWYAATGNWHRTDGPVNDVRFAGLMGRALTLLAGR